MSADKQATVDNKQQQPANGAARENEGDAEAFRRQTPRTARRKTELKEEKGGTQAVNKISLFNAVSAISDHC